MHSRSISFWPFGTRGSGEGGSQASISGNRLDSDQPPGPESSPWPLPESSLEASSALDLAISAFEKSCIAAAQQETWLIPAWFISFFNAAHGYGLPWWAAIASVNLAARFLLLPFFIFQQKETARMASFNYDMIKVKHLQEAMTKAKTQEEQTHLHSAIKQEYSSVMAKYPNALVSFTSIPLVLVGNGLVFISIFQATSNLMNTKAPSLRDGGTLWFTDLTAPDPYFGLPIICSLVTLALVEYGISMSGDQTPAGMQPGQAKAFKLMMRVMCLLFIPMGFVWSSGSGVLIATNSAFAVVQGMALRSPSFRHRVGLPSLSEVAAMSKKVAEASQPKKMEDATALANSILEKVAKDDQGRPLLFEEDPLKRKWKGQEGPLPPPPGTKPLKPVWRR